MIKKSFYMLGFYIKRIRLKNGGENILLNFFAYNPDTHKHVCMSDFQKNESYEVEKKIYG